MNRSVFLHERLEAYKYALAFFEMATAMRDQLPVGLGSLGDELDRAAGSIQRCIAEGAASYSRAQKKRYFRIALGSAGECAAILDQIRIRRGASADALARARAVLESATRLTVGLVRV